jgi:hypothetical protein
VARLCHALNISPGELAEKLILVDASDINPALHEEHKIQIPKEGTVTVFETSTLFDLKRLVETVGAGLVIVDNASDAFNDDEIKRARVRTFIRSLRTQLARPGRAVLLLAHINKTSAINGRSAGSEDYSGSTAWHNSVRSRLSLTPSGEGLLVEHLKANLGEKAPPVKLTWHHGVPLVDGTYSAAGAEYAKKLAEKAAREIDAADKNVLVTIIADFDRRGETVTTAIVGSAPVFKLLKSVPSFPKNTNSERLTRLLRELEDEARIFRRSVKTLDRKQKIVFTTIPEPKSAPNAENGVENYAQEVAA